ncbi:MAG: alpha/beta fold hydrolase [Candidatus Sumerlaeota bacterium]|nr:alpha/beta fold hydrolase [Candidatus Sumerlaeota bacterium]
MKEKTLDWSPGDFLLRASLLALLLGIACWTPKQAAQAPPSNRPTEAKAPAAGPDPSAAPRETAMTVRPNIPFKTLGGKQFWADERVCSEWRIQRNTLTGHCRLLDPDDVRRAWGNYDACDAKFDSLRRSGVIPAPSTDTVILLHGIWRAKESMRPLRNALRAAGYEVVNLNYPSTQGRIEEHAAQLARVIDRLEGAERLSFVTHSMGGLVVRRYLSDCRDPRIGRFVMIAPPNHGATLADWLDNAKVFRPAFGPAGPELRADAEGAADDLAIPWRQFGVIAGGKGDGKGFNPLLRGDNDMTVEVASAKLDGMADFLLVRRIHTVIMKAPEVIEATKRFLRDGRFEEDNTTN